MRSIQFTEVMWTFGKLTAMDRRLLERGELHVDLLKQYLWKSPRFAEHISTLVNLLLRFDLLVSSSEKDRMICPILEDVLLD